MVILMMINNILCKLLGHKVPYTGIGDWYYKRKHCKRCGKLVSNPYYIISHSILPIISEIIPVEIPFYTLMKNETCEHVWEESEFNGCSDKR